jgi:hypothetical protein
MIKKTGQIAGYIYYRCTHNKGDRDCSQRGACTEQQLTSSIAATLAPYSVPTSLIDYSLRVLTRDLDSREHDVTGRIDGLKGERVSLVRQQQVLTQMRYRELIGDAEFVEQHQELENEIARVDVRIQQMRALMPTRLKDRIEEALGLFADLHHAFTTGGMERRRLILAKVGSDRRIADKKPLISMHPWLKPIAEKRRGWLFEVSRFGLTKTPDLPTKKDAFASAFPIWSGVVDEVVNQLMLGDNHSAALLEK